MTGFTSLSNDALIRANLWSNQIKDILLPDLQGMRFVDWLTNFPDGTTFR